MQKPQRTSRAVPVRDRRPRPASRRAGLSALVALLCLAAGRSSAAAAVPGLVAAYGFEEASGTTVADASGNGNTGTTGGATWIAGKFGTGLNFNGSFVTVPDSPSLDLTTAMTLSAWVYPSTPPAGWQDVIFKAVDVYYLEGSSTSGGSVPAAGGSFAGGALYGTSALPVGVWSHLAATYDGVRLRLYVNGVEVSNRPQSGTLQVSGGALTIGGDASYGQYWIGRIDEVRIYNRALSAAEIQSDMATAVAAGPPDSTPPSASITAPAAGAVLSHVAAVSASATDNDRVVSVDFFADGASIGTDDSAPFSVNWNTTAVANGAHSLTAVAHDAAGNPGASPAVAVSTLNPAFSNEVVVPDISSATTIAFLPDGRMLVGELIETIWVVQPGANQIDAVPFLQLDASDLQGEQGLMDILIDPDFAQSGYYYVFYTRGQANGNNHNRVSRFRASGNTTVQGSEVVLWEDDQVAQAEHHGGALAFGPDGKLYITYGEQFVSEDAQRLDSYRGKVLRIGADGSVPTDNPFYDGPGPNRDEIWAYGLRNPFRMSFDPPSGRLFIGDVGGNDPATAKEEINVLVRGANYGWPLCEGPCGVPGTTPPIYWYPHLGRDASITGGFVYRGSQFPAEYRGSYFFADYVQNWIQRLVFDGNGNLERVMAFEPPSGSADGPYGDPVKLVEGPDGALYYVDIGFNDQHVPNPASIRRIRWVVNNQPPVAVVSATPRSGLPPLSVSFSSAGSSDPEGQPLSYNWDFGDGTVSTAANPNHTYVAAGPYVARLWLSDGVNTILSQGLDITVGNPPTATITAPANGRLFRAGDVIPYSGSATDPEDGTLPASAFSWTIVFHHDTHTHPAGGPFTNTKTGSLTIPVSGHDFAGDTSYEIILRVTDSNGLYDSKSVFVVPDKVNLLFQTSPAGLAVDLDGIRRTTPFVHDALIGFQYVIHAPQQTASGTTYEFASWSDGGAQTHGIVVPASDAVYTATFQAAQPSGLVAAYGFEEGSGSVTADDSGHGNTGTLSGAAWTTLGKYGSALVFNGTSALVTVPSSTSINLTTAFTLSAWVYPTSSTAAWKDVVYRSPDVYYLEGASPQGAVPATGGTFTGSPLYGVASLPVNTWSHLASTYDGAALRLYVNGQQVATRSVSAALASSSNPLTIGGNATFGQYWTGRIDEVRVYERALSPTEIQTDMAAPVETPGVGEVPALAARKSGSLVAVTYTPACRATDHAVFWGQSPINGQVAWSGAQCGFGTSGSLSFSPPTPPAGRFVYWVVVGQTATLEGGYGTGALGAPRPEAAGLGICELPASATDPCP